LDFRQVGFIERGEINPKLDTIQKLREGLDFPDHHLFRGL